MVLTTHICILKKCLEAVVCTERLLSLYISDLRFNFISLLESADGATEWELAFMLPLLEALLRGDYSKLDDDIFEAGREEVYDLFAEGEENDSACFVFTHCSHQLMCTIEIALFYTLHDIGSDDGTPGFFQHSMIDSNRQPSCAFKPLADPPPQPTLDNALVPPILSLTSPEPLWLPYFCVRLDDLILELITAAFQLLWQPGNGSSVIKQVDLVPHQQLGNDQQHKLHVLQQIVTIIFQKYTLLCISLAGSYESAAQDGALISQGCRYILLHPEEVELTVICRVSIQKFHNIYGF